MMISTLSAPRPFLQQPAQQPSATPTRDTRMTEPPSAESTKASAPAVNPAPEAAAATGRAAFTRLLEQADARRAAERREPPAGRPRTAASAGTAGPETASGRAGPAAERKQRAEAESLEREKAAGTVPTAPAVAASETPLEGPVCELPATSAQAPDGGTQVAAKTASTGPTPIAIVMGMAAQPVVAAPPDELSATADAPFAGHGATAGRGPNGCMPVDEREGAGGVKTDAQSPDRRQQPQGAAGAAKGATNVAWPEGDDSRDVARSSAATSPSDGPRAGASDGAPLSAFAGALSQAVGAQTTSGAAAPAEARMAASPGSPEFAQVLGAQISVLVRDGIQHAVLQLHPVEMGPLTVQIQLDGATAQVHLAAEWAPTRDALNEALPTLAGTLQEAGFTLGGGGVFEQPRQPADGRAAADRGLDAGRGNAVRGASGRDAGGAAESEALRVADSAGSRSRGIVDLFA